jgi:Fur family zinc uptake transcriptional regulator
MTPAAPCPHAALQPPARADVARAVTRAEARCLAAGERWTPTRRRIYELLAAAGRPVKAYDLIADFAPGRATKPPTVYRALDFLVGLGLAHRLVSQNAFVACTVAHAHTASEFLICDCCGRVAERRSDVVDSIMVAAAAQGFQPRIIISEVHGVCGRCQKAPTERTKQAEPRA